MKLISGKSSFELASHIASRLGKPLTKANLIKFPSHEVKVEIENNCRGKNICIIQSTSPFPNDSLMELFFLIDAVKRLQPKSISLALPYLSYARQDHKLLDGESIAINCVANLLKSTGIHNIIVVDIHSEKAQSFFEIPFVNIETTDLFAEAVKEHKHKNEQIVIVSPDEGGRTRAVNLSNKLNVPYAIIKKQREKSGAVKALTIDKEVKDKTCYLVDDIIDTAHTLLAATNLVLNKGAKKVHACVTHGIFSHDALEKINNSPLQSLIITNTIDVVLAIKSRKIKIVDIASLLAKQITLLER
jgi:ribose-phosphate pyrophosphokinase